MLNKIKKTVKSITNILFNFLANVPLISMTLI